MKINPLIRIEGRAKEVFEIIRNISQKHPYMTLAEASKKGLLKSRIQHTVPYELGKYPEVWLDNNTDNN